MNDELYLRQALALAERRRGFTSPNPAVGALVVRGGEVLGEGFHEATGHPHAEVAALAGVEDASGSTVYVTLEPCCHFGRTPPCSRLLISRGVRRVVFGFRDPNPLVAGGGARELEAAGIAVEHLPLADIDDFYRSYAHWVATGTPFVVAKLALSLDGKIAGPDDTPIAITGPALGRLTHHARRRACAILTTARTILCDDPRLDARAQAQETVGKPLYIVDTWARTPATARALPLAESVTLFHAHDVPRERLTALQARGVRTLAVAQRSEGLCLETILGTIGRDGRHELWVEAGGTLFGQLVRERRLQRGLLFVSPKWLGEAARSAFRGAGELFSSAQARWRDVGGEALCELEWS